MKKHLFILFFAVVPFILLAQKPMKGPLDAKIYKVDVVKDGKKKPMDPPEELKFTAGKFKSTPNFSDWGFVKPAVYHATLDSASSTYTLEVETINDIEEKMTWNATITGDDIEGTAVLMNKKGETKYSYTFTGKIKAKYGKK